MLDVLDRGQLIFGLHVREGAFEFILPHAVRGKGMAGHQLTRRVQVEQFVGNVGYGAARALLDVLPVGGSQAV